VIELTEDTRIQRMFAEGELTDYEVKCLRSSLGAQPELGVLFRRKPILVLEHQLWLLLGFLSAFFLLSVGMPWLISEFVGDVAASVAIADPTTCAKQPHRLIDHAELSDERSTTMNRSLYFSIGVVTLGVIAVLGALLALLYNGLVSSREQVNAGWAQVENVYQRRLDLVPLLVDAVQTYTEHERETLIALTEARARAIDIRGLVGAEAPKSFEQLKAIETSQGAVKSALARLLAVVENYPDLKANQNFLTLQDQIEGTENRVAMERRNYNEFSRRHNTRMQTFPFNIVAELMGFSAKPYFEAEDKALKGLEDPFGRDKS
jgi:LemA protein